MSFALLEQIARAAQDAGFRAWAVNSQNGRSVAELFCLIHVDDAGRNYVVHGMFPNELADQLGSPTEPSDVNFLQCSVAMPFPVEETATADTARLLHSFNLLIPVGAFILSEQEGLIVFRAMLAHAGGSLSVPMVVEALRMIRFFVIEFSVLVEPVAQGQSSCDSVIGQLRRQGVRFPTVGLQP